MSYFAYNWLVLLVHLLIYSQGRCMATGSQFRPVPSQVRIRITAVERPSP